VRTTTARIATINIAKAEFGVASAVANAVVETLASVVVEVLTNAVVEMPVTVVPALTFCDPSMN
jgi:hypothetical protein